MVEFSSRVEDDLAEIADWIAEDSPSRAVTFVREIRQEFYRLEARPQMFRLRPELGEGARLAVHGRYVIWFRAIPGGVRIERVVHGGRDLANLDRDWMT